MNFAPKWEVPDQADVLFETTPIDITGSDVRIGIVRGRDLSGEWGISYVHKKIKDGSRMGGTDQECFGGGCLTIGEVYTYNDVTVSGVIFHKFIPFGTIKRRVQIGLTVAGGVGKWKGDVEGVSYSGGISSSGNVTTVDQTEDQFTVPAEEVFAVKPIPLGDVQISIAAILAPGLKVRASGGMNFPGYQTFSIAATYLFGAR